MEYNSQRQNLIFPEYGRNVYKLANYILTVEDKEKRTSLAFSLVKLMRQLNPSQGPSTEHYQRIWDHLHLITDLKLDIDSPYPKPEENILNRVPQKMQYRDKLHSKYMSYGSHVTKMIKLMSAMEDKEKQQETAVKVGKTLSSLYQLWNREILSGQAIVEYIKEASENTIDISAQLVENPNLFHTGRISNENGGKQRTNKKQDTDKLYY